MKDDLQILKKYIISPLLKKYSSNGLFFTNKEFEKHKGEILMVGGALRNIVENVSKQLPETI